MLYCQKTQPESKNLLLKTCLIKPLCFSLFPWEQFALDREQRRCGGGGQWGRRRAGRQQVMCLPPECLHMLCVRGFMAVPPSARIPHWPGVRGHRGVLYSWPAGPAQPCHPPAERESYTQTHRHTVYLHTYHHVHTPGQATSTDAHAGQPCRHWCILEQV